MEHHSRQKFEWYAYNNSNDDGSSLRQRFRLAFDRWVNVFNTTDDELAERIRTDEIDVLVDLNGVTGGTRVQVLANGVAPVQATWIGMPGSVGADDAIDYQIVDQIVVDKSNISGFQEKLVFLPRSYVPRDPLADFAPDTNCSRSAHELPEDAIVFCSFNQPYKFSPETVEAWAKILNAVEGSVLWLMGRNETIEKRFLGLLQSKGISPERVIYAKSLSRPAHLERLKLADLMLDNWPYNAGTTCTDALISGVPMLTLARDTFVSRVGSSILKSANLNELTSKSIDEYIQKAVHIGSNREYRDVLKKSLRERFLQSTIVDGLGMARLLEVAYKSMVDRAASGLKPEHLFVRTDNSYEFSSELKD
jgi:predicted O-linked N-acetylglucosamine transferase (SPINDLY family)